MFSKQFVFYYLICVYYQSNALFLPVLYEDQVATALKEATGVLTDISGLAARLRLSDLSNAAAGAAASYNVAAHQSNELHDLDRAKDAVFKAAAAAFGTFNRDHEPVENVLMATEAAASSNVAAHQSNKVHGLNGAKEAVVKAAAHAFGTFNRNLEPVENVVMATEAAAHQSNKVHSLNESKEATYNIAPKAAIRTFNPAPVPEENIVVHEGQRQKPFIFFGNAQKSAKTTTSNKFHATAGPRTNNKFPSNSQKDIFSAQSGILTNRTTYRQKSNNGQNIGQTTYQKHSEQSRNIARKPLRESPVPNMNTTNSKAGPSSRKGLSLRQQLRANLMQDANIAKFLRSMSSP